MKNSVSSHYKYICR